MNSGWGECTHSDEAMPREESLAAREHSHELLERFPKNTPLELQIAIRMICPTHAFIPHRTV